VLDDPGLEGVAAEADHAGRLDLHHDPPFLAMQPKGELDLQVIDPCRRKVEVGRQLGEPGNRPDSP